MTSSSPTADSARLALPGEADSIAELQRRAWAARLPAPAAETLLADIGIESMAEAWRRAIVSPPRAQFRVLVATAERRVVGFASTIPSPDPDADPEADGLIDEFAIDPPAQRRGHGSRLLHACVDTLRADGFSRATWWVASTDDVTRGFLLESGWAADGGWREIGTDDAVIRLRQIRMHTDIRPSA
ncbi:MAG: GNAT family N-acetyltransferase [Propionibacteriaceae bacterium]|nr:GNAT family N-acetyltransferase [Propionibacteriaceae bacterium]